MDSRQCCLHFSSVSHSTLLLSTRPLLFPKWNNSGICKAKQELRCAAPRDSAQPTEHEIHRGARMDGIEKPFRTLLIDNNDSCTQNLYQLLNVGHGADQIMDNTTKPLRPWNCFDAKDGTTLNLKERWRRSKISQANKGRAPWNKGKFHSPETVERIKARTLEAMQDPRVREKLKHFGQRQSKETRLKISSALMKWWTVAKATKEHQATCITEWQESIAEVARRGGEGDEEYQWNSFQLLKKQLEGEWKFMSQREAALSRNCSKSMDHRKKIAVSIRAKWADPNYRLSVSQGIQHYLDRSGQLAVDGSKRRIRKKAAKTSKPAKIQLSNKSTTIELSERTSSSFANSSPGSAKIATGQPQRPDNVPVYSDPLAKKKLDIVSQIRANRLAKVTKRKEAVDRARILMAQAEKAVRTLEIAATKDKDALVPLLETRKLLAEAALSIQTAGLGKDNDLMRRGWLVNATSSEKYHPKESSKCPTSLLEPKDEHEVPFVNATECDDDDRNDSPKFFPAEFIAESEISMINNSCPALDVSRCVEAIPKKQSDYQATHGRLDSERQGERERRKQWVKGRLVIVEAD